MDYNYWGAFRIKQYVENIGICDIATEDYLLTCLNRHLDGFPWESECLEN